MKQLARYTPTAIRTRRAADTRNVYAHSAYAAAVRNKRPANEKLEVWKTAYAERRAAYGPEWVERADRIAVIGASVLAGIQLLAFAGNVDDPIISKIAATLGVIFLGIFVCAVLGFWMVERPPNSAPYTRRELDSDPYAGLEPVSPIPRWEGHHKTGRGPTDQPKPPPIEVNTTDARAYWQRRWEKTIHDRTHPPTPKKHDTPTSRRKLSITFVVDRERN